MLLIPIEIAWNRTAASNLFNMKREDRKNVFFSFVYNVYGLFMSTLDYLTLPRFFFRYLFCVLRLSLSAWYLFISLSISVLSVLVFFVCHWCHAAWTIISRDMTIYYGVICFIFGWHNGKAILRITMMASITCPTNMKINQNNNIFFAKR